MVSKPHGGRLVNRVLSGRRRERLVRELPELPKVELTPELAADVSNIAHGVYSPLEGFLTEDELESVISDMRLPDDTPWTIPVVLDVDETTVPELRPGDELVLSYGGEGVAVMEVEEVYEWDKRRVARRVFGTDDLEHPGVRKLLGRGEYLVGGKVGLVSDIPEPFEGYRLWPAETRILFRAKGWRTVVGFQTRNVPHLGHEYVQKAALTFVDGLFINPLVGWKKPGDFRDAAIVSAYQALMSNYFPRDSVVFSVLRMEMKYAGPREAIHHAIVRKNFGCTHFIIGRDHAGVGGYYGPYDSWDIFREFPDLGIVPLFIREAFYCKKCGGIVNEKICAHEEGQRVRISGTKIRELLSKGMRPSETMMRPEVADEILKLGDPFVR